MEYMHIPHPTYDEVAIQDDSSKDPHSSSDHAIHASGKFCAKCGDEIEPFQDMRRRGTDEWVHDVCPVV
ncbi:MAG: hypothetical protein ACM3ML_37655 [Micromonosporaceae bacterium]